MIDFPSLREPVSDELPCGPDLEVAGDDDFLSYVASAEGHLPASFFSFVKDSVDFQAEQKRIGELLERTRDLRLLVLAAKFSILSGDLAGFADWVEAISALLSKRWKEVHPQGLDGDYSLRRALIESLDDMPTVTLPLQYAPLVKHRRIGTVSLRSSLIAAGEVSLREGETAVDAEAVREALLTSDDLGDLKAKYDAACRLEKAVTSIAEQFAEATDYTQSVSWERLPVISSKIRGLIEPALIERDPTSVQRSEDSPDASEPGGALEAVGEEVQISRGSGDAIVPSLQSLQAAVCALKAAEAYFARQEPSSPSLLLIRQAQQLIGRSFLDAMRLLVPAQLESATIDLGGPNAVSIPLAQLDPFAVQESSAGNGAETADGGPETAFSATSRPAALGLIEATEKYFMRFEPSSPVPLLLGRARGYASKDFVSLLNEFAPPKPK